MGTFYAGRIIAGLGIGAATVLIPMYAAEMSPKEIRGRLGACFQLFFAMGVMVAYWVTYGVSKDQPEGTAQWQIALGLQLLPSTLLLVGMCTVKESARWLALKGKREKAYESLVWVRGGEETEEVRAEFDEIIAGIEEELRIKENFSFKELLLPANRYRMFIAVTIQLAAQLTGNTSLAYYANQIFSAVGAGSAAKLVTGFFGVVKVVGVLVFQLFVLDRIGRRVPFMVGAGAMGSFMLIIACILATHPVNPDAQTGTTHAGIASIIMVYAEAASYNMSWGPLPWLYMGEMFSSRTREVGVAVGAASQWLFNFMMSQVTPHAINNIGWRMFLMFAIFNYAIIVYSWIFLKEVGYYLISLCYSIQTNLIIDLETLSGRNAGRLWRTGRRKGGRGQRRNGSSSRTRERSGGDYKELICVQGWIESGTGINLICQSIDETRYNNSDLCRPVV